jgi:hypothetical protein
VKIGNGQQAVDNTKKIKLIVWRAKRAQGLDRLAGQTRLIPVGIKCRHAAVLLRTIGVRIDETALAHGCVGDKNLAAVEQIAIAVSFRDHPHTGHVRPGIGLGNCEATDLLA